uniref:Uncharacterized protein n=1 Tax=Arion vulgaris TaxID=1028688 RepID=A0A0B6YUK0_9EUPU
MTYKIVHGREKEYCLDTPHFEEKLLQSQPKSTQDRDIKWTLKFAGFFPQCVVICLTTNTPLSFFMTFKRGQWFYSSLP